MGCVRALFLGWLLWATMVAFAQDMSLVQLRIKVTNLVDQGLDGAAVAVKNDNNQSLGGVRTDSSGVANLALKPGASRTLVIEVTRAASAPVQEIVNLDSDNRRNGIAITVQLKESKQALLLVTVLDQNGERLPGAQVDVSQGSTLYVNSNVYSGRTDTRGVASILVRLGQFTGEGVFGTKFVISATYDGAQSPSTSFTVRHDPPQLTATLNVPVSLPTAPAAAINPRAGSLQVIVTDAAKRPLAGAKVVLTDEVKRPVDTRTSDADGLVIVDLRRLTARTLEIEVSKAGLASARDALTLDAQTRRAGVNIAVTLTAVNQSVLNVKVVNKGDQPIAGARVTVTHDRIGSSVRASTPDYVGMTDALGTASIAVQLGRYTGEGIGGTTLLIEATREEMRNARDRVTISYNVPRVNRTLIMLTPQDSTDPDNGIPVEMLVLDQDGNKLEGATVRVSANDRIFERNTGADGKALIEVPVILATTVLVQASKENFSTEKTQFELRPQDRGTGFFKNVELNLRKISQQAAIAKLTVRVRSTKGAQNSGLISDARVRLQPQAGINKQFFNGKTGQSGEVTFEAGARGVYDLDVSQDTYLPDRSVVTLDGAAQTLEVLLDPKPIKDDSTVDVTVRARDKKDAKGRLQPIQGATVRAGRMSTGTDEEGHGELGYQGDLGVEITVEAPDYKSKSLSVSGNRYYKDGNRRKLTFDLDPSDPTEQSPIEILIEVFDRDEPKVPIAKATVKVLASNGAQSGPNAITDDKGLAKFPTWSLAAAKQLRAGAFVEVNATGYLPDRTSIDASQFKPSRDPVRYSVYLQSELQRDLAALATEVGKADKLREPVITSRSAAKEAAAQANAAFRAALKLETEWQKFLRDQAPPEAGKDIKRTAASFCRNALAAAKAVDEKSQTDPEEILQWLEAGEGETRACVAQPTREHARNIGVAWVRAFNKVTEIVAASTRATQRKNEFLVLVSHVERTYQSNFLSPIRKEIEKAKQARAEADAKMAEASRASDKVLLAQRALKATLDGIRARNGHTGATTAKMKTLAARINALAPIAGEIAYDKAAEKSSSDANEVLRRVEENFGAFSEAGCKEAREIYPAAVERLDVLATTLQVALDKYKDLRKQAAECLARAQQVETAAAAAAAAAKAAATPPQNTPAPPPLAQNVTVPNLAVVAPAAWPATVQGAGLTWGGSSYAGNAPTPAQAYQWANQNPPANSVVAAKSVVTAQQWLAYITPLPTPLPPVLGQPAQPKMTFVPNLAAFLDRLAMENAVRAAGLQPVFVTPTAATPIGQAGRFAGQNPAPMSQVALGSPVSFAIWPAVAPTAPAPPTVTPPPLPPVATTGVPSVVGMSLENAKKVLERAGLRVGGIDVSINPPSADWAERIFVQNPAAGQPLPANRAVGLRQYKVFQAATPTGDGVCLTGEGPFRCTGRFIGSYQMTCFNLRGPATLTLAANGAASLSISQSNAAPYVVAGNIDAAGKLTIVRNENQAVHRWDAQFSVVRAVNGAVKVAGGGKYEHRSLDAQGRMTVDCTGSFTLPP